MSQLKISTNCIIFLGVLCVFCFGEGEAFEPVSQQQLDAFYAAPERHVTVRIYPQEKLHSVAEGFLGINLSYFNTTDDIWKTYKLQDKLKAAGVGSLRYPGGEETSFFHWQHPGVNGYEDIWDDKAGHGTAPGRGRFQTTWVQPGQWPSNEAFMNFDEFMENCIALGVEPIVGINLSSGRKHNRRTDGIAEALEWMRYCKKKNYKVTYWFLDNEPWHGEGHYTFKGHEYTEEVLAYGTAIKKEFPDVKLIANPTSSGSYNWWEGLETFVRQTGEVIDFIDVHWYWAWGQGSFDLWKEQIPLRTGDKWKRKEWDRPYVDDIRMIKETIVKGGHPEIGLVVLEWNVAPSDGTQTFSQSLMAVVQAELLMEYLQADVRLTCLWPLLWRTSRDVWSEQDFFASIITQDAPYAPTLSLDMFRLISAVQGGTVIRSESSSDDCRAIGAVDVAGKPLLLLINKSPLRRRVYIESDGAEWAATAGEMIALKQQVVRNVKVTKQGQKMFLYAEPYSFIALRRNDHKND